MLPTRPLRVTVVALAVVAAACGNPALPKATYPSALNSYTLYPVTGAPANVPTALSFLSGATRADSRFAFDVAFELNSAGAVLVYPVRVIGGGLVSTSLKRIGMQPLAGAFDGVTQVPSSGYDTLSVQTVMPGTVLGVEILDVNACYTSLGGQTMYAKMVVDSVIPSVRRIYARTVVDLNCGYHQVVPDSIPTS
jgi:hypothetical protein